MEVDKNLRENVHETEDDQLLEEVTFDICFYIYGGPEQLKTEEKQVRKYSPLLESPLLSENNVSTVELKAIPDIWRPAAERFSDRVALVDPHHDPPTNMTYKQVFSFSFVNPKERDTPLISNHKLPSYIPTSEQVAGQQIVDFEFPAGTSFYGTGEVSGQLERTGKRIFTWNIDACEYGSRSTSLYQSHPWVLVILPGGEAFGILADTTKRCEIDLCKESIAKLIAPEPFPVITFGPFASATNVLTSLSHAIGTVFMPPKWSLGYQQCRWSYVSDSRVREENYPNPKSLADDLHGIGFQAIWMLDPGIKHDTGYFVNESGSEKDIWVQTEDGKPFVGDVWPGPCVFPDFTQEKARSWWANLVKDFISNGVDGMWNDMNEPAIFKSMTKTMPESNIHKGDAELGGCQNHSYYHNVYGMLMARL